MSNPFGIPMADDGLDGYWAFKVWRKSIWPLILEKPLTVAVMDAEGRVRGSRVLPPPTTSPTFKPITGKEHRQLGRQQEKARLREEAQQALDAEALQECEEECQDETSTQMEPLIPQKLEALPGEPVKEKGWRRTRNEPQEMEDFYPNGIISNQKTSEKDGQSPTHEEKP